MVIIIVLLILAAVTINLTIGENGIFKRAQDAVDKYEIAALEEKLKMEELTAYIDTANGDNFSEDPVKGIYSYETLKNEENIEIIMDCIIELDGQLYRAKIRGVNEEIQLESAIKVKEVEDITKPLYYFMSGDLENINVLFVSEDGIVVTCKGVNYILKYEENDRYYKMYTEKYDNKVDENPGELIGEGLETSPYLIQSIEDLVAFSLMSENKSFLYEYVSIDRDLDFNLDNSYVNPNTTEFGDVNKNGIEEPLKTELTTGAGFRPIAYGNDFKGTFNGSGYSIKNLYMNCEMENKKIQTRDIDYREYVGLFGILDAGTIKNLKVTGSIKSPLDYVGGIVGRAERKSKLENCISEINITSDACILAGGMIGTANYDANIINCINYGNIDITTDTGKIMVGGIAGSIAYDTNIANCSNYGNIRMIGNSQKVNRGDIYGGATNDDLVSIYNCVSEGNIEIVDNNEVTSNIYVGGISGFVE